MNNENLGDGQSPENTSVEIWVLQLLADGETLEGISKQFTNSPHAVHIIASNAVKKLGAKTMTHGVAIALRLGIIE